MSLSDYLSLLLDQLPWGLKPKTNELFWVHLLLSKSLNCCVYLMKYLKWKYLLFNTLLCCTPFISLTFIVEWFVPYKTATHLSLFFFRMFDLTFLVFLFIQIPLEMMVGRKQNKPKLKIPPYSADGASRKQETKRKEEQQKKENPARQKQLWKPINLFFPLFSGGGGCFDKQNNWFNNPLQS